ncbi:hypothetical protein IMSHALPRED_001575 [Imshaugia aleurites]|uniref:Ketosynthase family 3 (KS3) domain-containing protein n=1 Tax=Imshaugia aleurites TaxID=172621 RepID=A0A8H3J2U0_9LECA|nr:hypothetical protein IMSHALPRED_001575 [Imshaugia aleurites]
MSALTEDKAFVPPFGKSYFTSQLAHSVDNPSVTPTTTPGLTTRTSPGSSNEDLTSHLSSDIAVVGMACRIAGDNPSSEELWNFLMVGKNGCGEMDPLRWEPYRSRNARNAKELDKITSRGYFVPNISDFDNMFFGISPKEAEKMDPQQRISLEVCWEALESAGIAPQSLAGSNTAVYMGVNSDDYGKLRRSAGGRSVDGNRNGVLRNSESDFVSSGPQGAEHGDGCGLCFVACCDPSWTPEPAG